MAKPLPTQAHDAILAAIRSQQHGLTIQDIEAGLAPRPNRRTLQRWLRHLVAKQQLRQNGRGRATRYVATNVAYLQGSAILDTVMATAHFDVLLPLSEAGREVAAHVQQLLPMRKPVGYKRTFLDGYRPNQHFYLPEVIRQHLRTQGQAASASEPAGTYARHIAHRLLIDLSWNSSRLEGNTYSLLETEHLISAGQEATGKNAMESQMILNHKEAIEFLIASASDIGFNRYTVLNLHALLADNLLADPSASGRLRCIPVGIGHTVFIPLEGPQLIDECFQQVLDTAAAIADPFEQAFFAMVHLPYLQPFEDVNKRVSRLAANIPLIQRNLCPLSFVDVPQALYVSAMLGVYELNRVDLLRDVFVWAYERSCARYSAVRQSLGEPDPFRIQHRTLIADCVAHVVRNGMTRPQAINHVRDMALQHLLAAEQARFVEVVHDQLMSLHEGNMARYRLRPSEFAAWWVAWER